MTDKQIIIDGVDVNKCEFFKSGVCVSEDCISRDCKANSDCKDKQLKRLQAELEQVKKENEGLKETLGNIKPQVKFIDNEIAIMNVILLRTLKEIEDIAQTHINLPCMHESHDCNKCHDELTQNGKTCMEKGRSLIINKIEQLQKELKNKDK